MTAATSTEFWDIIGEHQQERRKLVASLMLARAKYNCWRNRIEWARQDVQIAHNIWPQFGRYWVPDAVINPPAHMNKDDAKAYAESFDTDHSRLYIGVDYADVISDVAMEGILIRYPQVQEIDQVSPGEFRVALLNGDQSPDLLLELTTELHMNGVFGTIIAEEMKT